MTTISKYIRVNKRFARSANLNRDVNQIETLQGYVVTARANDVIKRVAQTASLSHSGGSWSITGPYGSGKSSLALLLDAAFGPNSELRRFSINLIRSEWPRTVKLIQKSHHSHGTKKFGFHRGIVTAQREPVINTVLRALHYAVLRSYGKIPPVKNFRASTTLKHLLKIASNESNLQSEISPASILEIAKCLAIERPLLIIIDEFGKNLESIEGTKNTDPYILQQLVETGQTKGIPIFILTLQHLSFGDYFRRQHDSELQEWKKVQGRFEDIAYIESASQARALIGTVFEIENRNIRNRIENWARSYFIKLRNLGISDYTDSKEIANCYPLHPLTSLVLPELCNRYGQHERTMFSFLTSAHENSVATFIEIIHITRVNELPSVGLDSLLIFLFQMELFQISQVTKIADGLRSLFELEIFMD